MRTMLEYLLSKKKQNVSLGFPKTPKYDDVIDFLESRDFKLVDEDNNDPNAFVSFLNAVEKGKYDYPVYHVDSRFRYRCQRIIFSKGKDPEEDGIVEFILFTTKDGSDPIATRDVDTVGAICTLVNTHIDSDSFDNYEEFTKTVKKHFGWQ